MGSVRNSQFFFLFFCSRLLLLLFIFLLFFYVRLKCANDRRAKENWKVENIFPEVFLLEFITENFVSLNYFCLAIFPFSSQFLRRALAFSFPLYFCSPFFFILILASAVLTDWRVADEITTERISEGSDSDPNGLVDSLKFYHWMVSVSAWCDAYDEISRPSKLPTMQNRDMTEVHTLNEWRGTSDHYS